MSDDASGDQPPSSVIDRLNFDWISNRLAVGGSFPTGAAGRLAAEHGVQAVVDMREEACDDAAELEAAGLAFLHLPTPDLCAVSASMLDAGANWVRERLARGERVLIHCEHGIGRSATLALCVLAAEGVEPLAALKLAKVRREKVSPSPEQYECWSAWLRARGLQPPAFDDFAAVAYRHLR